jgi:ABC-type methionine transport system ATPase subunit
MSDASPTHQHVRLTFPPGPATEPVIYEIVTRFGVVPNIRRAAIHDHSGWMVCDLGGEPSAIEAAVAYMVSIGVDVSRVEGDIVEG